MISQLRRSTSRRRLEPRKMPLGTVLPGRGTRPPGHKPAVRVWRAGVLLYAASPKFRRLSERRRNDEEAEADASW